MTRRRYQIQKSLSALWLTVAALLTSVGSVSATEIWLSGVDPYVRKITQPGVPSDYLQLFQSDSPWKRASLNTSVFKTSSQFLIYGSDAEIRSMINNLRERHILLAVEMGLVSSTDRCGRGEGYSTSGGVRNAIERLERLGGSLSFVAMDEGLWYGHHTSNVTDCQLSIPELVASIAKNIALIRETFPDVRVGDIEPISPQGVTGWNEELSEFMDAYEKATGSSLSFLHADVDWQGDWRRDLAHVSQLAGHSKVPFGIIYNGTGDTDVVWTETAEVRFSEIESSLNLTPDMAIFQSWEAHPASMLPEMQAGTLTNQILQYVRPVARLNAAIQNGELRGRLTQMGAPVSGAQIKIEQIDSGGTKTSMRRVTGTVPGTAVRAVLGLRLNAECLCSSAASLRIGPISYKDGGLEIVYVSTNAGEQGRVTVTASQDISRNSPFFPVRPGQPFNLSVDMAASTGSEHAGYLVAIFLDAYGREVKRARMDLRSTTTPLGTVLTDQGGYFVFKNARKRRIFTFRTTYVGSSSLRRVSEIVG